MSNPNIARLFVLKARDDSGQFTLDYTWAFGAMSFRQGDIEYHRNESTLAWSLQHSSSVRRAYSDAQKALLDRIADDGFKFSERSYANDSYFVLRLKDQNGEQLAQLERYIDADWRCRELTRIDVGIYRRLPESWGELTPICDHFAHIALADSNMVAFTENPQKGERDIQTLTKPGRYLAKFYPTLSGDRVRFLAAMVEKDSEIRFAKTADDIEAVYRRGPRSCMGGSQHWPYEHPCRVYGAGDLAVAYLGSGEPNAKGFAVSDRVLVWPDKLRYTRFYGSNDGRLRRGLEALGYRHSENLNGAKLLRIEAGDGFVMPYIDYAGGAHDNGEHLVIDDGGDISTGETGGVAGESGRYCGWHEENCDDDGDGCFVDDYGWVCSGALSDNFQWCDYTNEFHHCDNMTTVINSRGSEEYVHTGYAEDNFYFSNVDDKFYTNIDVAASHDALNDEDKDDDSTPRCEDTAELDL